MNGWIKLHRKIIDNPVFDKPELFHLFAFCIMAASHDITRVIWNGEERDIERGSFIAGRKSLSDKLKQSESKIYRNLKVLEKLNMITLKSNNRFTLINVVNYCNYQGMEIDDEQQMNNKRTTNEQQMNTIKNIRTKELKKKDIKNKDLKPMSVLPSDFSQEFETFWEAYPNFNRNKKGAFKAYQVCLKGEGRLEEATPDLLLNAAKRYSEQVKYKDKQYVLHATTFLGKDERWAEWKNPQSAQPSGGYQRTEQEEAERKAEIARWASMREEDDTPK